MPDGMTDEEFEALKEQCRQERKRGLARHWSYELAFHSYLYRRYLQERQRRDLAAIDEVLSRTTQLMEAAG